MVAMNGNGWKRRDPLPPQDEELPSLDAQKTPQPPARALAIVSGKGGVGRSTFAANLAVALARSGRTVVLVDGHLDLPNLDLLIGLTPHGDLHDVVSGEREVAETLHPVSDHLRVLPGRLGSDLLSNLDEMRSARLVSAVFASAAGSDWLILDTPPGLSRASLAFALPAPEVILLTTPEPAAVADAYATLKALTARRRSTRIRIVVNRAGSEDEARRVGRRLVSLARRSLEIHPEYFGLVYEDAAVTKAAHLMKPFVLLHPEAPASVCIADLASRLATPPGKRVAPLPGARREVAR
jgi:flagellar biosynthesis protein FlhG